VVYIGPRGSPARLAGVVKQRRSELQTMPAVVRERWLSDRACAWEVLSQPHDLAEQIARDAGAKLSGGAMVPHDLWPAWQGPRMSAAAQLALVLASCDLAYELADGGRQVQIVPLPEKAIYEESYASAGDIKALADAKLRREGPNRMAVLASAEQHEQIAALVGVKPAPMRNEVKPGVKVYSFTAENKPLGAIVKTIAGEMELELEADGPALVRLQELTSITVKQVEADELLKQVLRPAGLSHRISGRKLILAVEEK
jgi:hypothetical protein